MQQVDVDRLFVDLWPKQEAIAVPHKEDKRPIAYELQPDGWAEPIGIVQTQNGWWGKKSRVEILIQLIRKGQNKYQAAANIGVSKGSLDYFLELHPDAVGLVEASERVSNNAFTNTLYSEGAKDLATTRWLLGKTDERFKTPPKVETPDKPLQPQEEKPSVVVQQNVNIDAGKITEALRAISREIFGAGEADSEAIIHEVMESGSQAELQ